MAQLDGWDLQAWRDWLRKVVHHVQRDPRLSRRFDSSDLVQQTLLQAHQAREGPRGQSEAEKKAWMRRILENVVKDRVRRETADRRDVGVEQLAAVILDSSLLVDQGHADDGPTPMEAALANERDLLIQAALARLPERERLAVQGRLFQGKSLDELAAALGCTPAAVGGLLLRGKARLKELLKELREDPS